MPHTYTQLYIHIVFAAKYHHGVFTRHRREQLERYMIGIAENRRHKILALKILPDHAHLLIGFHPDMALSALVRDIKAVSSKHVNEQRWVEGKFHWQNGYGAFSYSRSQIKKVAAYIENQEEHHRRRSFQEEYLEMLQKFGVEFDAKHLFEDVQGGWTEP